MRLGLGQPLGTGRVAAQSVHPARRLRRLPVPSGRILDAIWAWRYDGVLPDEFQDAVLGNDLDTYGWLWAIVGIVLILAGLAVMQRSQWARWIGILAGAVLTITAIGWMPFYPVWSLVYIFVGIFVIYGLAAHGGRLRSPV